jgi:hypothetical protein
MIVAAKLLAVSRQRERQRERERERERDGRMRGWAPSNGRVMLDRLILYREVGCR